MDPQHLTRLTREYYDRVGSRYRELFANELQTKEYERRLLDEFATLLPRPSLVCDAACGPTPHAGAYIKDRGCRVCGVDLSPRCLALARLDYPDLPLAAMDLSRVAFADDVLNGLLCWYGINYTPRSMVTAHFREMYRVLKSGGGLLLATKGGTAEGFRPDPLGSDHQPYFVEFTAAEIEDYCRVAGFCRPDIRTREPYEFEIPVQRIYALAWK